MYRRLQNVRSQWWKLPPRLQRMCVCVCVKWPATKTWIIFKLFSLWAAIPSPSLSYSFVYTRIGCVNSFFYFIFLDMKQTKCKTFKFFHFRGDQNDAYHCWMKWNATKSPRSLTRCKTSTKCKPNPKIESNLRDSFSCTCLMASTHKMKQ